MGKAAVKERPILFSAPMVRALLAGTKTQTRRVWKMPRGCSWYGEMGGERAGWFVDEGQPWWLHVSECRCPYGQPGDRLWVREAFMHEPADYCWEASVSIPCRPATTVYRADYPESRPGEGWKPSIHMPRALSRITLEVTGGRIERLQEISEADAIAEGCAEQHLHGGLYATAYNAYSELWESINGPGSWDANPWVWCVEFRRV